MIRTLLKKNPLVGAGLLVGAGFVGYFVLKKLFAPRGSRRPKITAGTAKGLPVGWSPYPLALQLKNEMTGLQWGIAQRKSWVTLAELPTDDMVIAVYEAFNEQYFNLGEGTLTDWIRDETGGMDKQLVLNRLVSLQLP